MNGHYLRALPAVQPGAGPAKQPAAPGPRATPAARSARILERRAGPARRVHRGAPRRDGRRPEPRRRAHCFASLAAASTTSHSRTSRRPTIRPRSATDTAGLRRAVRRAGPRDARRARSSRASRWSGRTATTSRSWWTASTCTTTARAASSGWRSLALKLAEAQFMRSETEEQPILLLDDILSELDPIRRGLRARSGRAGRPDAHHHDRPERLRAGAAGAGHHRPGRARNADADRWPSTSARERPTNGEAYQASSTACAASPSSRSTRRQPETNQGIRPSVFGIIRRGSRAPAGDRRPAKGGWS